MEAFPQLLRPSHRIKCVGVWKECVLVVDQTRGVVGWQIHHFLGHLVPLGGPRFQKDRLLVAAGKAISYKLDVEILEVQSFVSPL